MNAKRGVEDFTPEELRIIEARWKSDMDLKVDKINKRTFRLELMGATAIGAILILGWLGNRVMDEIKEHAKQITEISIRQASAISERAAHIDSLMRRDSDILVLIDRLRDTNNWRRGR